MKVGFTGTQKGMTAKQKLELRNLLSDYRDDITEFHHGDCIGADEEAHAIAVDVLGAERVFIHPPEDGKKRAFCKSPHIARPRPYLERNHDIVDATQVLIAAPKSLKEEVRSGTWATVRYARKCKHAMTTLNP